MQVVKLGKRGVARVRSGHPWIYRSDLAPDPGPAIPSGDAVLVVDHRDQAIGTAFYSVASKIALRLLAQEAVEVDRAFLLGRLRSALELRERIAPGERFLRLVHGEGDLLPGLVVDRYGDHLSIQTLIPGTERRRELIADLLEELLAPAGIVERNDARVRVLEGLPERKGVLRGTYQGPTVHEEGAARMHVDLLLGQKTGAFLDQRENHVLAGTYARGAALDLFSYVGGFALQLARRAASVRAVEISAAACEAIRGNAKLSGVDNLEVVEANAFDRLRDELAEGRRYDTIVLDPPAFAKSKDSVAAALRGYKEVNLRALQLLAPGGILITCTCSYHVSSEAFEELVLAAANDARRPAVLFDLGDVLVRLRFDRGLERLRELGGAAIAGGSPAALDAPAVYLSELALRFNRGALEPGDFLTALGALVGVSAPQDALAAAWCDIFEPWPEMEALANDVLAAGHPLYVLSNTDPLHLAHLRLRLPLLARATGLHLSFEVGALKPEPVYFTGALARFGLRPAETVFIDDRAEHIAAARALGVPALQHRGDPAEVRAFLRRHGVGV